MISYGSRTLNKAEKNYCITDKELLAIRHFTEYYRQYLLGRKFLVRSDHQALTFLFRLKEPKARIARWIEILSAFDFSIEYCRAEKHGNADSLTRCDNPWDCTCSDVDNLEPLKCGPCAKYKKRFQEMQGFVRPHADDPSEQKTEQVIAHVCELSQPDHRLSWQSHWKKRHLFSLLMAKLSTLFYPCLYYSLICRKTLMGGCQVCNCF